MFRKIVIPAVVLAISCFLFSFSLVSQNSYEGTQACGVCHKTQMQGQQLKIWKDSEHAKAYNTLLTDKAKKYSPDVEPSKNSKCLKCHTTGYGSDAKYFGPKFKIEEGVQCESCHGAGSAYKPVKIMKNRSESIRNGLIFWRNDEEIKSMCKKCHNEDSPTHKKFDFGKEWAKIEHRTPRK
jgi:hypothetical protein